MGGGGVANNTGADQPVHPRSLISAFVIRFLESITSRLATSEISLFLLVSVAEETGLSPALSETPKTGFVATKPINNEPITTITEHMSQISNLIPSDRRRLNRV